MAPKFYNFNNVINVYAFLFCCLAVSSVLSFPLSRVMLRQSLTVTELRHSALYEDIKTKRFNNPDKVLPEQSISGMEGIREFLIILDDLEREDAVAHTLYPMHYESLSVFREAFFQMAVKEQTIEDYNIMLTDVKPSFHKEVAGVVKDIEESLKHMRQVMRHEDIDIPSFDTPVIILPHEVDGKICEGSCEHERHLYIHQQFNYYINRAIHSIALIEEGN